MTRKKILLIVFTIVSLAYFSTNQVNRLEYLPGKKKILPYPSSFTIEADIYYVNGEGKLETEPRTISVEGNHLVEAVFGALKKQPAMPGCYSVITEDVDIISSRIVKKKLYLNLTKSFVESAYWKGDKQMLCIYSLVNSITQFDKIEKVQLQIEEKDIFHYMTERHDYADFTFNDEMNYKKPESPEKIVLGFLNMISLERYDAAYQMIEKSGSLSKDGIIEEMKTYRQAKKNYEILRPFSRKRGDLIDVYIRYHYYDSVRDTTYDGGTRIWQLREKEDGEYRIVWPAD